MTGAPQDHPRRMLQKIFDEGIAAGRSDGELVERFVKSRDQDAFAVSVARQERTSASASAPARSFPTPS